MIPWLCAAVLLGAAAHALAQPEQVSVSATETYSSMVITWVTFSPTEKSQVQYGVHSSVLNETVDGVVTKFEDGALTRYIHRVTLQGLAPLTKYDYRCGSPSDWSRVFTLRTLGREDTDVTLAVYGDFGEENARSLPWLQDDASKNVIDAILHCGDMAYDLYEKDGRTGDAFMNQVEVIASQIPYMVAPGNHEWQSNFTHYKNRYSMPGNTQNLYYSWDIGPAHVISFNTEFYFFVWYGLEPIKLQYEWMLQDLKAAASPEQRAKRPWIITMAHHPMYCSTLEDDDCNLRKSAVRVGLPPEHKNGLEELFHNYGVDISFWGHKHIYERTWPVFDYKVMNGSKDQPYVDPKGTVHVTTGSAGCREGHSFFRKDVPDWLAFRSSDYGYSRLSLHNATHATVQQISADKGGAIVDSFTIVKSQGGGG